MSWSPVIGGAAWLCEVRERGVERCGFQGGDEFALSTTSVCKIAYPLHDPIKLPLDGWSYEGDIRNLDLRKQARAETGKLQRMGESDRLV
jgi:hypothetical protein